MGNRMQEILRMVSLTAHFSWGEVWLALHRRHLRSLSQPHLILISYSKRVTWARIRESCCYKWVEVAAHRSLASKAITLYSSRASSRTNSWSPFLSNLNSVRTTKELFWGANPLKEPRIYSKWGSIRFNLPITQMVKLQWTSFQSTCLRAFSIWRPLFRVQQTIMLT